MVLADEKKKNDRLLLDELRKKLLELMQMNQQLPENCRIDRHVCINLQAIIRQRIIFQVLFHIKNIITKIKQQF